MPCRFDSGPGTLLALIVESDPQGRDGRAASALLEELK